MRLCHSFFFFFFNDTATTEIYTLSLHDALPIWRSCAIMRRTERLSRGRLSIHDVNRADAQIPRHHHATTAEARVPGRIDRKSTRLNSSHGYISYAVFCLKKKKTHNSNIRHTKQT